MKFGLLPLYICILLCSANAMSSAESKRDFFIVKAGIMEPSGDGVDRLRETNTISMDPSRKPGFCFIVDPPNPSQYQVYSVHHLPKAPAALTGDFAKSSPQAAVSGIQTETSVVNGIRPFCFEFNSGDPIGDYQIEVFINGNLNTTLNLNVVSK